MRKHDRNRVFPLISNLDQRQEKLKEMARAIRKHYDVDQVVLFGSHAYGNPDKHSDVDLLVVLNGSSDSRLTGADIRNFLHEEFGILFPMDILVRSTEEYEGRLDKNDMFLKKIKKDGIKL